VLEGELRKERAMAAAAGVPARQARSSTARSSTAQHRAKRPTGKRTR
jgi:preprotein translocase subunit SecF